MQVVVQRKTVPSLILMETLTTGLHTHRNFMMRNCNVTDQEVCMHGPKVLTQCGTLFDQYSDYIEDELHRS